MVHGDDNGLRLPPNIAPIQIAVVPIYRDDEGKKQVLDFCGKIKTDLAKKYRVKVDERDGQTPGFKFNYWEVRGVPVRLEIGGKEVAENKVTVFRRDNGTKEVVAVTDLTSYLKKLMKDIHKNLYRQAAAFAQDHIYKIKSWDEIDDRKGWFEASWSEDAETEKQLKERFGMVSRVLLPEKAAKGPKNKKCFISGKPAKHDWLFAKCY
jgi:prolyl-tRNA synthetase